MKTLDQTDPAYIRAIEDQKEVFRIQEDLGEAVTPEDYAFQIVLLEMKFLVPEPMIAITVATDAKHWAETRNPHYIDRAVSACSKCDVAPPPSLAKLAGDAATLRLDGNPAGTANKIKSESAKWNTFYFMANLVYHGLSLEKASSKAATWYKNAYPSLKPMKPSTLWKYYEVDFRKRGLERSYHAGIANFIEREDADWQSIIDALPDYDTGPDAPSRR